MLAVGCLEGGNDALVMRLNNGGDIRWKEDQEYIMVLESSKYAVIGKIFCILIYHLVGTEVVHQRQHFYIFILCSNTMRELSNYLCEYIRVHPGGNVEVIGNAVVAKRINAPTKSTGTFGYPN